MILSFNDSHYLDKMDADIQDLIKVELYLESLQEDKIINYNFEGQEEESWIIPE